MYGIRHKAHGTRYTYSTSRPLALSPVPLALSFCFFLLGFLDLFIYEICHSIPLDEIPQIWNVFTGEMSLVGPRPIMKCEYAKYSRNPECFDLYSRVLPGITGLWQISGRSDTTYAERMRLDSYYVRNWSPWMDTYILARTVQVVIRGEGAY